MDTNPHYSKECNEALLNLQKIAREIVRLDAIKEEYELHGETFCLDYSKYDAKFSKMVRKVGKIARKVTSR